MKEEVQMLFIKNQTVIILVMENLEIMIIKVEYFKEEDFKEEDFKELKVVQQVFVMEVSFLISVKFEVVACYEKVVGGLA